MDIFLGFVFAGLFYGFIVFMCWVSGITNIKWLYTIPIWPLALLVLLICIILRGAEVLLQALDL
jgi:hypothetical protein